MGWTPVNLPGGKPASSGLGPYREPAVSPGVAALIRPWRATTTGGLGFLTMFAIGWNGILAAGFLMSRLASGNIKVNGHAHGSWAEALKHDPWIGLFIAIFPLIGIGVAYLVAAIWINHTRVELSANTLSIRRGPLPWRNRLVTMATSTIQQLHVQEYVSHEENDVPKKAFRVMARLTDGRDILIDRGMGVYADARALEQWLEERLEIVDQPVAGEAPRPKNLAAAER